MKKLLTKKRLLFLFIFALNLLGLFVAFFEKKNQLPFHLPLHLLRFFSWWSVHASLLSIFALVALLWEEKNKKTSWLSQFILLSATIFNLVSFLYCLAGLFRGALKWKDSFFLNFNFITWHFVAPPLILFCFYSWGKINLLRKKLTQSVLCSFIWPSLYFIYVYLLSRLNNPLTKSKISLYLKKYPYGVFQFLARKPLLLWMIWLPLAFLIIYALFWFLLWTRMVVERKWQKSISVEHV